jgi:hypothetical protein
MGEGRNVMMGCCTRTQNELEMGMKCVPYDMKWDFHFRMLVLKVLQTWVNRESMGAEFEHPSCVVFPGTRPAIPISTIAASLGH